MKVTKLTESKKVKDRYYLELEDGSSLKVNLALIADHGLFTGRELEEEELERLKTEAASSELKARALRITGARAMSRREITDRLVEKGAEQDDAEATVDWLERIGVVNDAEYAGMIVRHYTAKGYGAGRIKNELYRRGVPKEYWEDAMGEMTGTDETLDRLVASKLKNGDTDGNTIKKLTAMLQRRGFSWEEIRGALERHKISTEETDYEL